MNDLEPHLRVIRRAAEAAWLARLNAGFGFADPRLPGQAYLRDPAASARQAQTSLRPEGSHRKQAAAVDAELAAAVAAERSHRSRLTALAHRLELAIPERVLLMIALAYELDLDVRELAIALAPRRRAGLWLEAAVEIGAQLDPRLADPGMWIKARHAAGALAEVGVLGFVGAGLGAEVTLSSRALAWLGGDDRLVGGVAEVAFVIPTDAEPGVTLPPTVLAALDAVRARLVQPGAPPSLILLRGPRGSGRRAAAHRLATALDRDVYAIDGTAVPERAPGDPAGALAELLADAALRGAVPLVTDLDALQISGVLPLAARAALRRHPGHVIVTVGATGGSLDLGRPSHEVRLTPVTLADRERAWTAALARHQPDAAPALAGELAARYVLGPGAIAEVSAAAAVAADGSALTPARLEAAVSQRLSLRLGAFGTVLSRKARFAEMVLPDDVVDTLRDLIAMVSSRAQILERWGYQRHLGISRGVSALFSGDPGTGKTMAASVIASELGLELVRIDLAAVVSKFVGETEKNLGAIFDQAQDAHAMLLFDEADGLFGKRTEVKTAQDRFANLEVNYLLQRMESFDGVSVLTTNLESSIDPALLRRLNFRVRFPAPEREERVQLWQRLLPPAAVAPGAEGQLNLDGLADRFVMSGGYIKNSVVRAAVIAARAGRSITADDLWAGAHHEYAEMGKVMPSAVPTPRRSPP